MKRKDLLAVKAESDARYKAMFETIDSDIDKVKKDMEEYQARAKRIEELKSRSDS
jgi:hypothetical protein